MYYKQCENCAYDIVDDEGQIMDHECDTLKIIYYEDRSFRVIDTSA